MTKKITKAIPYVLIFILYYSFSYIFSFLFEIFNVDLSKLNSFTLILILILMELIPLLFMLFVYRKDLKKEFIINKKTFKDNFDNYIRLWLFGLFLMTLSNTIITLITNTEISNNEQAVRDIASILPIYSLFTTCICAPLGEELAYRKTIGKIFTNKKLAIVMSGLIFGLAHVLGTYHNITDLLYVIPYGLFGSVFMYMYLDSKTIWSTISVHFMHNTILMISYLIRL